MIQTMVTIYFDVNESEPTDKRLHDMVIIEHLEGGFKDRLFKYFSEMKYAWNDYSKVKQGYRAIMSIESLNLTSIKVFK